MNDEDFWRRTYLMTVKDGVDTLIVRKANGSDWSEVSITVNDMVPTRLTLRSKEMAEQLHFMLGQMLDRSTR